MTHGYDDFSIPAPRAYADTPADAPVDAPQAPPQAPPEILEGVRFTPFGFTEQPQARPIGMNVESDGIHLEWEPADTTSVYRVVARDDSWPYSPDDAEEVVVTWGTQIVDTGRPRTATRYYQVWRYEAQTVEEASVVQPILHAKKRLTRGIQNPNVRLDEQYVVGKWNVLDGIAGVHVYRIPAKQTSAGVGRPEYKITGQSSNLQGFTDGQGTPGESYIYQFVAVATDGVMSEPFEIPITIPVRLQAVTDLRFTLHEPDESQGRRSPEFDLTWTTPRYGRVEIYRTEKPPVSGLDKATDLTVDSLHAQGFLTDDDRLAIPVHANPGTGTSSMFGVPWPTTWTRAYFTPVVMDGDKVQVGTTIHGQRVNPVSEPRFTERIGRKIISFAWPPGADTVRVYRTHLGGDAESALGGVAIQQIDESTYRDQGGVSLPGEDDRAGSTYYLVAGLFSGGKDIQSAPIAIDSIPLTKVEYGLSMGVDPTQTLAGTLFLRAVESELHDVLSFCLIHNDTRLPLHRNDGRRVALAQVTPAPDEERRSVSPRVLLTDYGRPEGYTYQFRGLPPHGFVRAFLDIPVDDLKRYALIDPAVSALQPILWWNHWMANNQGQW